MKNMAKRASAGRPREFDMDKALDGSLRVFWLKGYDGASLTDLTKAMGINRPSMYAAFGNKEQLYCKTLERYSKSRNEHLNEFFAAPTARESVELLLRDSVEKVTDPKNPDGGCFGVQGAMTCFNMSRQVKEISETCMWRLSGSSKSDSIAPLKPGSCREDRRPILRVCAP